MRWLKKCLAGVLVVMLGLLFIPAPVRASQVITLEEAKIMAREQGSDYRMLELGFLLAEASYISVRKNLGLGIRESQEIREDLDGLRGEVERLTDRITELREQIRAGEAALEQLDAEADEEAYSELELTIKEAEREKAELEDERGEYGRAIYLVINRYHATKAREDAVQPQIRPLEQQLESAEDAMKTMPRVLDYNVEGTYLGLLTLASRKDLLENNRTLLETTLRHARIMEELGMNVPFDVQRVQENLRQVEGALHELQTEEDHLQRIFRSFLGLHSEAPFILQPLDPEADFTGELPLAQEPNLEQSVAYQRARQTLERKEDDLEDTSTRDAEEYRKAELEVEHARLNLEDTLQSLEDNYAAKRDRLLLAGEKAANRALDLENARTAYRHAEIRYSLGMITATRLKQAEIALLEAELGFQVATQEEYLARQAYLLARDGIET